MYIYIYICQFPIGQSSLSGELKPPFWFLERNINHNFGLLTLGVPQSRLINVRKVYVSSLVITTCHLCSMNNAGYIYMFYQGVTMTTPWFYYTFKRQTRHPGRHNFVAHTAVVYSIRYFFAAVMFSGIRCGRNIRWIDHVRALV